MSRNFELLQNLGREREMFEAQVESNTTLEEPVVAPPAVAPVPVEIQPLQLKMEGAQRDEMFKLVHRVFLTQGTSRGRMVVVSAMETGNGCSWICSRMAEVLAVAGFWIGLRGGCESARARSASPVRGAEPLRS